MGATEGRGIGCRGGDRHGTAVGLDLAKRPCGRIIAQAVIYVAGVICSQGCGDRAIEGAVVAVRKRRGIGDDIGIAIDELAGGGAMVGVEKR